MNDKQKRLAKARAKVDELVDKGVGFNPAGVAPSTRNRARTNLEATRAYGAPGVSQRAGKALRTLNTRGKSGAVRAPRLFDVFGGMKRRKK